MVHSSTGVARVPGNNFRLIIDRRAIKSLMVDGVGKGVELASRGEDSEDEEPAAPGDDRAIRNIIGQYMMNATTGRVLKLSGRGSGHGVGMCQWGAIGRARAGQDFRSILATYYPGATVGTLR